MKRLYIITGANGHLASTLIRQLIHTDCEIRGLILPSEKPLNLQGVNYYQGDVTDKKSVEVLFKKTENFEVIVIHAAGIITIADHVTPKLYQVNVQGTKNMIELCQKYRVKRLLYVSSVHAIPEKNNYEVIEEVSSFSKADVIGAYAKTKAEATQAVIDAAKKGLDAVIVHPSGITGPFDAGNNHIIQLIEDYISGKLPAGIQGGYDFVDVRDVANGIINAINLGKKGECYILSNRYYSVKELIEIMRVIVNGKRKILLPMWLAKLLLPLFEWIAEMTKTRPLFTRYSLYTLKSNSQFSHDKATMMLRYHPRDMKITLDDTIMWLKGTRNVSEF